jgi:hypothetical protein
MNNNAHIINWVNIESQSFELTTRNDINIWMDKFCNVDIRSPYHKLLLVV